MSVSSRSAAAAQRGRSFAGVPECGSEYGPECSPEYGPARGPEYGPARGPEGSVKPWPGTRSMPVAQPVVCRCGGPRGPATVKSTRSLQPPAQAGPALPLNRRPEAVTVLYPAGGMQHRFSRADHRRPRVLDREAGMATAEYAIATLAAVAFAALLVAVLGSGEVRSLLMGLIRDALTLG